MSLAPGDLGELGDLATALGLIDDTGDFTEDWLSRPGHYLGRTLANQAQREGLTAFIDEVLGGSRREEDADGRVWLPLFEESDPRVTVYLVLDDGPSDHVRIGLGVELGTTDPVSRTRLFLMPFRAAKEGGSVADPILFGHEGGDIGLSTEITLDAAAPAPGEAHLGGIGLKVLAPTDGSDPTVALRLTALQLPGTTPPRDLAVSVSDVDELDDAALDLVLGLVRAQVDSPAGPALAPLSALAGMLGIRSASAVPPLPLKQLSERGPAALAEWFEGVISTPATRAAWLGELAGLLGGGASVVGDEVRLTVGPAQVGFRVGVVPGSGGRPVVTPRLSLSVENGGTRARGQVDLMRLDLATGDAVAVPRLSVFAHLGRVDGTGAALLSGDPGVDAVRVGVSLDEARRPVLLLAADGVTLDGNSYDTLDLSTPDALVDTIDTALTDVVDDLLDQLGPAGTVLSAILGLEAPAGHPAVPTLDLGRFLQDPLAAVREHWRRILRDHSAAVPDLLSTVRDLLADAAVAGDAIAGAGTPADPWRVPLVGPVELHAWAESGGDVLQLALAGRYTVDTLGRRCTRVETRLRIGLARLDLAGGHAVFTPGVQARIAARARGSSRAIIDLDALRISADHVALTVAWTPDAGLTASVAAPNLVVRVDEVDVPLALPQPGPDGALALDAAGWAALESLIGALALAIPVPWVRDLVHALGWSLVDDAAPDRPRLDLAELEADAEAAIRSWIGDLALDEAGAIRSALETVARILTGSSTALGRLRGIGRPGDPFGIPLLEVPGAPQLAAWLDPAGPRAVTATGVPESLQSWRPGDPAIPPSELAHALAAEARAALDIGGLMTGRADPAAGLEALVRRWRGTDGRIVPPAVDPPGVTVHRIVGATVLSLPDRVDLGELLGGLPDTVIHVAVVASDGPLPWPSAPAGRVLDLRAPGLAPEAFARPAAEAGEWFVALAGRSAAKLASGDPDGIAGQAGRLARVLEPFAALPGRLAVVARGGAGHAARVAAQVATHIDDLVTLGTSAGPVALTVLDEQPAADALRLLGHLVPDPDPAEPDDPDLELGRELVAGLLGLLDQDDPAAELRPPATVPPPRAGLDVHSVFGVVSEESVRRAITAVTAAGLAERAMDRVAGGFPGVDATRAGIRIPLDVVTPGITLTGHAVLDLFGADDPAGGPTLATDRALRVHLGIRRTGGWLVGGPDPARGLAPRPDHELRWLEADLTVPLGGTGTGSAELTLHEPRVFGVARERWTVRAAGGEVATDAVVTPTLPEVRVLLSHAVAALQAEAAAGPVAALLDVLGGLGIVDASGGSVPDAIDHLLHDPRSHLAAARADAARRVRIASGIDSLLGAVPGLAIDLEAGEIALDLTGSAASAGMLDWTLHVEADSTGAAAASATVGSTGSTPAGGALLHLDTDPLTARIEWHRGAGAPDVVPLWPAPDGDAMLRALGRLVPAEVVRLALDYLRSLDETARAIMDAALDAAGLLTDAGADGLRRARLPATLLEDPAAWFGHAGALGNGAGFAPGKVAALLDAARPILGVAGAPGEWDLAPGVRITARSVDGHLQLGATVDTSAFDDTGADGRLTGSLSAGLTIRSDRAPAPAVAIAVGLPGAATGRSAVHVSLNGGLRAFIRPAAGADLPLYPDPPGLGQLADMAVTQALPLVLNALADETGTDLAGQVGEVVRQLGDALGLRSGTPPEFDAAALRSWADDPAAALAARLPALAATAIDAIADALDDVLPAPASATAAAGEIQIQVGGVAVAVATAPFAVRLDADVSGIPGVEHVAVQLALDATGLTALVVEVGPADIDAGGVRLRPYLAAAAGSAPPDGRFVEFGLGLDSAGTDRVGGRWDIDGAGFALMVRTAATTSTDSADVAVALLDAVLDLVASFALSTDAFQDLLDTPVPGSGDEVRDLLQGVLLKADESSDILDDDLFAEGMLLRRLMRLIGNFADAGPTVDIGGGLSLGIGKADSSIGLELEVNGRVNVVEGDVYVAIEADSRWIQGTPDPGVVIGLLRETSEDTFEFAPALAINGLGIRVGRSSGPLLDVGLTLGSVALHGFGLVSESEKSGGVQVELAELAVGLGGAEGGNPIAQGLLEDASAGSDQPSPAFSPALAVQKHDGGDVLVSLRAGEGDGPWWLAIQKGFGPLYIEQVGLGVTVREDDLERISLLLDGRVSIFGLTAAVDDLQLTFVVASDASPFDPSRWAVDLAGLAISADMAGVVLAGGLRKFSTADSVEYIGMLVARFATYGLSVFGGYGEALDGSGQRFAAFFAFGAVNGPIGGPPAFFLTGIGGGLGINRGLVFPTDFSTFGDFVFLKALDPAASASSDPMAEMAAVRSAFPMRRGEFWFAAGLSFNSFALVDGIAVLAVAVGDGLEITLLGLARMALPRPEVALVSIELGLMARFSTKEGVLWIQAQLTDNSWLLHESVRLTGGFAFVTWYKGPNEGQFVLTLGGYHPDFHREGYPVVPRLGFNWSVSNAIVIKGENYFALTSEAVMAGGRLEASAHFGPAWASLVMGADGIVFFDPFRFKVEVYARISAGITIDVWIGEITISISLGARIMLEGPKFRGKATFEVGPVELTVKFGSTTDGPKHYLEWEDFVDKYLEAAAPARARAVTALPGKGQVPPGTGPGGETDTATADGSAARPFEVLSEFELTITTTVPTRFVRFGSAESEHLPSRALGLAPMNTASVKPRLQLRLREQNGSATEHLDTRWDDGSLKLRRTVFQGGGFPVGVWGRPQDDDDPKVPSGDVIRAVDRLHIEAAARFVGKLPAEVPYHQIETGPRHPLPFVHERGVRSELLSEAAGLRELLPETTDIAGMYAAARPWLEAGGHGRTSLEALRGERAAPPRLGSLAEGLAPAEPDPVETWAVSPPAGGVIDVSVHPAELLGILSAPVLPERAPVRTGVSSTAGAVRVPPPTLTGVRAATDPAIAMELIRVAPKAGAEGETLIAGDGVPLTRLARGSSAAVAGRGAPAAARERLAAFDEALLAGPPRRGPNDGPDGPALRPGEIAVLRMPNAERDVGAVGKRPALATVGGPARVVVLAAGGEVLADAVADGKGSPLPESTDRIAVLALGDRASRVAGLAGWHAGMELPYLGWSAALGPGTVVRAEGHGPVARHRQRFRAGWVRAAELVADAGIVITRFTEPVTAVVVALDDLADPEAGRFLALDLIGADRPTGRDGEPVPPALVVSGNRSFLVYAVVPGAEDGPVTVTVGRDPAWEVAGVLAAVDTVPGLVERLARSGLDTLVRPLAAGRGGAVELRWDGEVPETATRARARRDRALERERVHASSEHER